MSVPFTKNGRAPCRHYMQKGMCARGKNCPFAHVDKRDEARNSALSTMLKLVFEKNRDKLLPDDGRILDLSNFGECPDLQKLSSSIDFNNLAFCDAIASVVREVAPITGLNVVNLDNNGIRTLNHLLKAFERADLHMNIRALSACDNSIATLEFVKLFKPFENLIELRFSGNPVADKQDYRLAIRRGLPKLEGLDGTGVNRPPLNLPWPRATEHEEQHIQFLQLIEQAMFRSLEEGGSIDGLSGHYADDAVFSLTCPTDSVVKPPNIPSDVHRRNDFVRAFVQMRLAQTDRNNDLKEIRTVKAARGRTDVCSALRNSVYPRAFNVNHVLSPDSTVVAIGTGLKGENLPAYIVTFHGRISWLHKEIPEAHAIPVSRLFDRSMTVYMRDGGAFFITNDMITLRLDTAAAPIWYAQTDERALAWSTNYEMPPEVVRPVMDSVGSDIDLDAALREIRAVGPDGLDACAAECEGDTTRAVVVARAASRSGCVPSAARAALEHAGWDLDAAVQLLAGGGATSS